MIKYYLAYIIFFASFNSLAKGVDFELDRVELPVAINILYSEIFTQPYMISPELANDSRLVTFKITSNINARKFIERYFQNMNIAIYVKDGVDYITPYTPVKKGEPKQTFIYTPRYRSVSYLSDILKSQVSGDFGSGGIGGSGGDSLLKSGNVNSESASGFLNRTGDVLVFHGTKSDIRKVEAILPAIDTSVDEVIVRGYIFEVQTSERNGSGLALAAKLLSGKVDIQIGSPQVSDSFIKISTGSLDALYEIFRTDNRFHVVSAPQLRVKNGSKASFSVGSDVPVLSQVTYQDDRPIQSVEYRSSGVLFNVQPFIRQNVIDLNIQQQLSNFVKTDTGVNNSPTLIKREVMTDVSVSDGDVIMLGGLAETKNSQANTGISFLPSWIGTDSTEKTKSDIVVILQAKKIPRRNS